MKRCDVCDSTEEIDTIKEQGIIVPILYWITLKHPNTGLHRCNRCQEAIDEAMSEMYIGEEETDDL